MPLSERIVVDPKILAGKPVILGTRIAVEFNLELLAAGQSESDILTNYPGLTREDILACLSYASYLAHEYKGGTDDRFLSSVFLLSAFLKLTPGQRSLPRLRMAALPGLVIPVVQMLKWHLCETTSALCS
jgi:uncharacterized protein (DUF433 family)